MNTKEEKSMIEVLSKDCIANILSHTTPIDSCRLSLISKDFCSASESDIVWNKFLPSDLVSIISDCQFAFDTSLSKKSLYLTLSDHPIIIDSGKKSFQLEKPSGKKVYMLSARDLSIAWGDTPDQCDWIIVPKSRFQEVARLRCMWWFEIHGTINTRVLSANSQYAAFLVFKMRNAFHFDGFPVELTVGILGNKKCTKFVWLKASYDGIEPNDSFQGLQRPKLRSDGFLEIEMGEFFNSGLKDEVIQMNVLEIRGGRVNGAFILEGIEIRPKN
ncbi:F-box protein PP2-B10-like [Trifolium pratense]|uniref:F-box protein PP2-B10-like n=1 Tax=Trifolium pratense TaxID=57577 RepID=UPI001E695AFB|nr:F-box protein PP2-B10-like [Trifolium pratense]